MKKRKTFKFKGQEIFLEVSTYELNNRLAILAWTKEGLFSDITKNLPDLLADGDTAFISDMARSSGLESKLEKLGIIKYTLGLLPYNYGVYDTAVFDMEKLKEYDPEGVARFEEIQKEEEEEEI